MAGRIAVGAVGAVGAGFTPAGGSGGVGEGIFLSDEKDKWKVGGAGEF